MVIRRGGEGKLGLGEGGFVVFGSKRLVALTWGGLVLLFGEACCSHLGRLVALSSGRLVVVSERVVCLY